MKRFYITTAIDYVNSLPHLGHSYEKICADVIARWHRLLGENVYFLTGTDENAQKNVNAAKEARVPVKEFVDKNSKKFKELCKELNLSNNYFIRTTEAKHVKTVQLIFLRLYNKKEVYKDIYEGLYCYGCENFYLEKDLENGKCPIHKKELEYKKEEGYFFKLSKYEKQILKLLRSKDFIFPKSKGEELINRIEKGGLKDLSVSRKALDWGIDVPFDNKHKIYVWIDALSNYISALDYPEGENFKKYWPANIHLIGKDIVWFHSVIWPAILLASNLEVPKTILVHGFINFKNQKMSKSLGNVLDPFKLVNKYGLDQLRYFLIREIPFGEDGDFSEDALKSRINNELANELGNLVNRVLTLAEKNFDSNIKKAKIDIKLSKNFDLEKINNFMQKYELHNALSEIFRFIQSCNKHINDEKPWSMNKDELEPHLYSLLESIRIIAILLSPFMPETSKKIYSQLGVSCKSIKEANFGLTKNYNTSKKGVLFEKVK